VSEKRGELITARRRQTPEARGIPPPLEGAAIINFSEFVSLSSPCCLSELCASYTKKAAAGAGGFGMVYMAEFRQSGLREEAWRRKTGQKTGAPIEETIGAPWQSVFF
jgi:hypothetical protein